MKRIDFLIEGEPVHRRWPFDSGFLVDVYGFSFFVSTDASTPVDRARILLFTWFDERIERYRGTAS